LIEKALDSYNAGEEKEPVATEVVLPMLGITVEKGKIVEWVKKEGDPVEKGEIIFIVEVEKATTEVESPASGILAKILVPEGVEVPVLTVVGIITEPGEKFSEDAVPQAQSPSSVDSVTMVTSQENASMAADGIDIIKAVPAARRMAREHDIHLRDISGTGPEGLIFARDVETMIARKARPSEVRASTLARRLAEKERVPLDEVTGSGVRDRIMRQDVQAFLKEPETTEMPLGTVIPMSTVRRVIARRMSESAFTAPHIYFFTDACLDPLLDFRSVVLPDLEKRFDIRVSINDFVIKAVALNIMDFPILNAQVNGDEIHIMPEVNVGLAVAMPEGLIVPAIRNADRSGLINIARQRIDLVQRARQGKLTLEEMERGTFTVSSLAQYDITHFTAILNPPQSGILSIGKTDEKLVMEKGQVTVKRVAQIGLSVDHRIIDGAMAADFLQNLKWKLERPSSTFLTV
jgi:pyruvate dehydrogenase E2 component (dihydrolipoamide acetyltransferase)